MKRRDWTNSSDFVTIENMQNFDANNRHEKYIDLLVCDFSASPTSSSRSPISIWNIKWRKPLDGVRWQKPILTRSRLAETSGAGIVALPRVLEVLIN